MRDPTTPTLPVGTAGPEDDPAPAWMRPWMPKFLEALAVDPNATAAAKYAGVNRQHAGDVKREVPEFRAAWEAAVALGVDETESFAYSLGGRDGVMETITETMVETAIDPVTGIESIVRQTVRTRTQRLRSAAMTMRILSTHRPEKWAVTQRHEVGGSGVPVQIEVHRPPSDERLLELARIALELQVGAQQPELEAEVLEFPDIVIDERGEPEEPAEQVILSRA